MKKVLDEKMSRMRAPAIVAVAGAAVALVATGWFTANNALAFNPQPEPPASDSAPIDEQFNFLFPQLDVGADVAPDNIVIPIGADGQFNPMGGRGDLGSDE